MQQSFEAFYHKFFHRKRFCQAQVIILENKYLKIIMKKLQQGILVSLLQYQFAFKTYVLDYLIGFHT
jgi:hypothetical protein